MSWWRRMRNRERGENELDAPARSGGRAAKGVTVMSWWRRMRNRERVENELDAELRDHVERQVADHVRGGLSEREARRRARLEFGGLDHVKEMCRDARGMRWIDETWRDLRFAVRLLLKERWFTTAAVLALGLGIGLTSTGFTVYNAMLVRGLPVDDQDRIMALAMRDADGRERRLSYLDFRDWRTEATGFSGIAAYGESAMTVGDPGLATERFPGARVTANTFRLLGVEPLLGRDLRPEDDRAGAAPVVMLGHGIWTRRYGGDPEVLGRVIRVDGAPATVVGVMPEGFEFPMWAELWQPLGLTPDLAGQPRDRRVFRAVGRLADGVTVARAQSDLDAVAARLAAAYPDTNQGFRPWVDPFNEHYNGTLRPALTALLIAAVIVLLIACANAANLLLARAARRSREVGMRVSLGATRARIVRQLLAECVVIAGAAGVLGLGLAHQCARLLTVSIEPLMAPFWVDFAIDGRVLAFLTATCLSAALIFGLAPALHTSRANVRDLATAAGPAGAAGRPARRWMGWLVTGELALTLVLLAGAGLMARSLLTLARADRVIDTAGVATMQIGLPDARYPTAAQRIAFFRTLHEQVAASPSIASVTRASAIPFAPGGAARRDVAIDGRPAPDRDSAPTARVVAIANDYFEALGLRLQRGRSFTDRDGTAGNDSVIVNRRFADLFLTDDDPLAQSSPDGSASRPTDPAGVRDAPRSGLLARPSSPDGSAGRPTNPAGVRAVPRRGPLGQRIRLTPAGEAGPPGPWLTIVGVSPTVRQSMAAAPGPVAYLPYRAEALPFVELLVRSEQGADAAARAVGQIVRGLDPEVPVGRIWTLDGVLGQTLFIPRLIGSLLGAFAWIALVLSAVGLYGVTAYAVTQRTQEIGVRMALGARAGQVRWMVLRRGLAQLGAGLGLGLWGALTVGRLFEAWLVDTPPTDPATQVAVAVLLGGVSVAACVRPARRAARLDPAAALRHE